jgi:hypothetical protein
MRVRIIWVHAISDFKNDIIEPNARQNTGTLDAGKSMRGRPSDARTQSSNRTGHKLGIVPRDPLELADGII